MCTSAAPSLADGLISNIVDLRTTTVFGSF